MASLIKPGYITRVILVKRVDQIRKMRMKEKQYIFLLRTFRSLRVQTFTIYFCVCVCMHKTGVDKEVEK